MSRFLGIVLVCLLVVGMIGSAGHVASESDARAQTAYANLEILIALDMSSSMAFDDVRQSPADTPVGDVGLALLPLNTPATDRNGERFDITRNTVQWLVRQLQSRPELDKSLQVYASVIGFDQGIYDLLDWTMLNTVDLSNLSDFRPDAPIPGEEHDSDFIGLYDEANRQFASHDVDGTTRRVLIVVTDSLPCKPEGEYSAQRIGELQVYNFDCRRPEVMTNHLQYAHTQLLRSDVVPIVLHVSSDTMWQTESFGESLSQTRSTWRSGVIQRNGEFEQLDSINQLPQAMFDVVAEQFTLAISGGNQADQAQIGQTLGLVASTGNFDVPPYQEYLEMLVLSQSATVPTIKANGDAVTIDETVFASNSGQMRYLRFDRPQAGSWTVQDPGGKAVTIRVMYRPASAFLAWVTADSANLQYQPVHLTYTIHDEAGEASVAWIDTEYVPQFTVSVQSPKGQTIDLGMTCDTSQCTSESFLPLDAGAYAVTFSVTPETNWPEITIPTVLADEGAGGAENNGAENADAALPLVDQYSFLKPDLPPSLIIEAVHFWRQVSEKTPASDESPDSSVQITQPRSDVLSLQVWAGTATDVLALPPGLTAHVFYDEGVGCPPEEEDRVTQLRQEGDYLLARPALQFETGDCSISMALEMASDLKPIGADSDPFPLGTFELADITSTSTARLSLALLDDEGNPLAISPSTSRNTTRNTDQPDYTMDDYGPVPEFNSTVLVTWPRETRSIEIAFLDEEGHLTHPRFVGETASTGTSGPDAPIPFRFSIVRADGTGKGNLAEDLGISLRKSEKEGIYVAEISGLDAGEYFVQFELLLDDPDAPQLNTARFEYDSSLTRQTGNPLLVAVLQVDSNPIRLAEIYGTAGLLALLTLVVLRAGLVRYRRTAAPLSGTLAIYMRSKWDEDTPPELVWDITLPTKVNTYEVPRRRLLESPELTAALFSRIQVSTHRNRGVSQRGGAYATITVGSQVYPLDLNPGEPKFFHPDEQGAKFYAVKFASGVGDVPPSAFGD